MASDGAQPTQASELVLYVPPPLQVDGDTSTNDCVIGLASGASGAPLISDAGSAEGKTLEAALTALLQVGLAGAPQCSYRCHRLKQHGASS
jgi:hypothetical protein